jgi:hypothetical protein
VSGPKDFAVIFAAARIAQIQARRAAERAARKAAAQARLAEQRRLAEKRMAEMAALRATAQAEARKRSLAAHAALAEQREAAARRTAARLSNAQQAENRRRSKTTSDIEATLPDDEDVAVTSPADAEVSTQSAIATVAAAAYSVINDLASLPDSEAQGMATRLSESLAAMADSRETNVDLTKEIERIHGDAKAAHAAAVERSQEVPELMRQVVCWQEELQRDEAVVHFCQERAAIWQSDARLAFEEHERGHANDVVLQKCQDLLKRAEEMRKEAEDTQAAYATRNELLADVLASLQEIGFFVSDPQFENPNNPAGPVLIKATRGSEVISASVDLSDTVRSTWDGVAGEHCKDAFFEYVDQMKARGIEVKPTRADLQDRPELKQKGARSLPRSDQKRRST